MKILIIDDDFHIRELLKETLTKENYEVTEAKDGYTGLDILAKEDFDVCFLDVWMPEIGGIDVLTKIKKDFPGVEVIMISGSAKIDQAVRATKLGAYDFLEKPLTIEKVISIVNNIEQFRKVQDIEFKKNDIDDEMIGSSPSINKIRELIANSAKSDARVIILGENGTGKELIARAIHDQSIRRNKPFVSINCAAIPENLIESELFGHVKGAFTGAVDGRIGKFVLANFGTMFLDEVADMSLATQAKLLRVLQEMQLTPIGSTEVIKIDVRVIAATNKDIKEEIKKGNFREDLLYRLNVIPINVSPLKERKSDIPELVAYFNKKLSAEHKKEMKVFSPEALEYLTQYSWPGNIRQLRNIVERLIVMVNEIDITQEDILKYIDTEESYKKIQDIFATRYDELKLNVAREEFERDFIQRKLKENDYNITKTAKVLGVYPSNLYLKINKLGIKVDESKSK
ncbi:MAG: sigma-54 dependent transcriptional regulator [Spirochaetes bacterium]|nr:sigma-54 dependent transcriptional regulator [Spirochaetota bacterium]